MISDRLKQCRSFNVMDKNEGLKEKSANIKSVNNKNSSVIKDFAETIENQDLKNSFEQKDQINKFTKDSFRNGALISNGNNNNNNQNMNMNNTEDKFIKNSLMINE